MKIALVTYALQLGGVETFLLRFWRFLTSAGHDVTIVQTEERGVWEKMFREAGCHVTNVLANRFRSRLRHASRIAEELKDFDLVVLNDAPFAQATLGILSGRITAFAIVHGDMPSMYRNAIGNFGQWDVVVGVSPKLVHSLITVFGLQTELVNYIPYGVEVSNSYPLGLSHFFGDGPLKLVFVGRIENAQKGVFRLPDIAKRAVSLGVNICMHIVGDGPDLTELKQMFNSFCPEVKVDFHGAMAPDDAHSALCESHVMILPSNFEGFPIVVLEAMASGVVPVVSRLEGMTDQQVDHGKTGWLCEPTDLDGFARALAELWQNRAMLQKISHNAWQVAHEKFSVEQMGETYITLIDRLISQRINGRPASRSGSMDLSLLGDFPRLPICAIRPIRRIRKLLDWS